MNPRQVCLSATFREMWKRDSPCHTCLTAVPPCSSVKRAPCASGSACQSDWLGRETLRSAQLYGLLPQRPQLQAPGRNQALTSSQRSIPPHLSSSQTSLGKPARRSCHCMQTRCSRYRGRAALWSTKAQRGVCPWLGHSKRAPLLRTACSLPLLGHGRIAHCSTRRSSPLCLPKVLHLRTQWREKVLLEHTLA